MNERSYETLLYSITVSVVERLMNINNWSEDETLEKVKKYCLKTTNIIKVDKVNKLDDFEKFL